GGPFKSQVGSPILVSVFLPLPRGERAKKRQWLNRNSALATSAHTASAAAAGFGPADFKNSATSARSSADGGRVKTLKNSSSAAAAASGSFATRSAVLPARAVVKPRSGPPCLRKSVWSSVARKPSSVCPSLAPNLR